MDLCRVKRVKAVALVVEAALVVVLGRTSVNAQEQGAPFYEPARKQLAFADQLFAQEDYNLAALEYRRFLFHFSTDPLAAQAKYKLGLCYMGDEKWDQALMVFQQTVEKNEQRGLVEAALFNSATCYSRRGKSVLARIYYKRLMQDFSRSELADDAQLMLALTYVDDGSWIHASDEFGILVREFPLSPLAPLAKRLASESARGTHLPHRSATAAGLLSAVLPGAGQAWCGRMGDGFFSLLLTATFTYLAVESYQNDNKSSACILGSLGLSFYMGNIYGAVNSAKKYNSRNVEKFKSRLKMDAASAFR